MSWVVKGGKVVVTRLPRLSGLGFRTLNPKLVRNVWDSTCSNVASAMELALASGKHGVIEGRYKGGWKGEREGGGGLLGGKEEWQLSRRGLGSCQSSGKEMRGGGGER